MYNVLLSAILLTSLDPLTAESDSMRSFALDEVCIVSSIKENGTMRQQPTSVSLIDNKQITSNHITSVKGTSGLVPNLFIPDYGSRLTSAIYIRGIGSRINTPAVGLYVDNIPYVDKSAFDFNFFDIENIDVLRGPQGVLYGRNTMGGLIRVYTKNPLLYQGTNIRLNYSSGDNHRTASLTHYNNINDRLAFSVGGYYEGSDGFFTNDYTQKKADSMQAAGGQLKGVYQHSEFLSFNMNIGYDYSDEGAYPYYYAGSLSGTESYPTLIGKISNNIDSRYRRGILNAGLNIEYKKEHWKMNAVTGYQNINDRMFMDQDFLSPNIYTLEQRQRINTITEELTFKSKNAKRWEWIAGANVMYQSLNIKAPVTFYEDGLRWLENNINTMMPSIKSIKMLNLMGFEDMSINFRGDVINMNGAYNTPTFETALFHQSTLHFTEHFSGSLGLRFDYEHRQMKYNSPADILYGFAMPNSHNDKMSVNLQDMESHILYNGVLNNDNFCILPKLAFQYDFDSQNNIYTSFVMGQRSGGYNQQMFSDLLQGAMRVDMIEGVKDGVGKYLDYLVDVTPSMPSAIPDPDHSGQMVPLPEYVRRVMATNMPQFEVPSTNQVEFKPEYSWNCELGTHLTLAKHTITLDGAVFFSHIYNQQIARFAPSGFGRMMVNAGRSRNYGGELSLTYSPDQRLRLAGNYGYTYAEFLSYDDGQGNNYAGKRVPFVPSHTMNLDASYTMPLNSNPNNKTTLTIGANCSGAGRIYWTESNMSSQPFYTLLGARASINTQCFNIMLWGKNLTNRHYNTFFFESASRSYEQHSKPLQVGVDIQIKL